MTSKTQYAVKTLVDLAALKDGELTTVGGIARRRQIPLPYLEQILLLLKRGGMVRSHRGRQGGYTLTRKGENANLADVMALTGDALLVQPEAARGSDPMERAVLHFWQEAHDQLIKTLEHTTIRDLRDAAGSASASNYSI